MCPNPLQYMQLTKYKPNSAAIPRSSRLASPAEQLKPKSREVGSRSVEISVGVAPFDDRGCDQATSSSDVSQS